MSDITPTTTPPQFKLDLSKYIEVRLFGERPHIRGRRIPVAAIASNVEAHGWTVEQTMDEFGVSAVQVLSALLYYAENKAMIDNQEAEEQELLNEMSRLYGKH